MMMKNFSFWKILLLILLRWMCAVLFVFILGIILVRNYFIILGIFIVVEPFFLYSNIQKRNKTVKVKVNLFKKKYAAILIILFLILALPLYIYIEPIMEWQSEKNKVELQQIVNELTKNATNDVEKTKAILSWFDRSNGNIKNTYGKKLLLEMYPLHIFLEKPYFCIRIIQHKYPLWILTSHCGACGEYSLLFREMANAANLNVRSIHNPGEDHNWDEVLIDGKWIIVDPTRVNLLHNSTGFNYSAFDYEIGRGLNISYVFAEYPNGNEEDISYRYTNLSRITFTLIDRRGSFISNAVIYAISNNLKNIQIDTMLNCTTNEKGQCSLTIGGGNYKFIAKTNDFIPLSNETSKIIEENKKYNVTLILKRDILKSQQLSQIFLIVIIILLWFSMVCYLELLKI